YTSQGDVGYFTLKAGPPGSIGLSGDFTYTFAGGPAGGWLSRIVDPAGNIQNITFGNYGPATVTDVNTGKTLTFTWTGQNITSISEGGGAVVTTLGYNAGKLSTLNIYNGANWLKTTLFTYESSGRLSTIQRDSDP